MKKITAPSACCYFKKESELKNYLGVSSEEEYYPALRKLILNNIITWEKDYEDKSITIRVCDKIEYIFKIWRVAHRDEL